jgi:hypothetical protein
MEEARPQGLWLSNMQKSEWKFYDYIDGGLFERCQIDHPKVFACGWATANPQLQVLPHYSDDLLHSKF